MKKLALAVPLLAALTLTACVGRLAIQQAQATAQVIDATISAQLTAMPTPTPPPTLIPIEDSDLTTTDSGLQYIITQTSDGAAPQVGDTVEVHYTGYLLDGTVFDSSYDRGEPIAFALGTGQVIPGWDEGIALLKVGEKATLIIPPDLGYGSQAVGPIPADSTLRFDVELVAIQ